MKKLFCLMLACFTPNIFAQSQSALGASEYLNDTEAAECASNEHSITAAHEAPQGLRGQQLLEAIHTKLALLDNRVSSKRMRLHAIEWVWEDLEKFQRTFWRALALDPANLDSAFIPEDHHPRLLNNMLRVQLTELSKARSIAELYNAGEEFDEYVKYARRLLEMRNEGRFRFARVDVKKGELERRYQSVVEKMSQVAGVNLEVGMVWSDGDRRDILKSLAEVRVQLKEANAAIPRAPASLVAPSRVHTIRALFWILVPLLFITGFIGGLIFKNR